MIEEIAVLVVLFILGVVIGLAFGTILYKLDDIREQLEELKSILEEMKK